MVGSEQMNIEFEIALAFERGYDKGLRSNNRLLLIAEDRIDVLEREVKVLRRTLSERENRRYYAIQLAKGKLE